MVASARSVHNVRVVRHHVWALARSLSAEVELDCGRTDAVRVINLVHLGFCTVLSTQYMIKSINIIMIYAAAALI